MPCGPSSCGVSPVRSTQLRASDSCGEAGRTTGESDDEDGDEDGENEDEDGDEDGENEDEDGGAAG